MTTRTIVTSQPDVACDVCERRLLRGEQPDVFVDAGRRRIVCELCAPRAAHEGWLRETDAQALALPPSRTRRGRSFLERIRQVARPPGAGEADGEVLGDVVEPIIEPVPAQPPQGDHGHREIEEWAVLDAAPARSDHGDRYADAYASGGAPASGYLADAAAVFNLSEFPRRIAGVARSLGRPEVTVRSAEHLESVVRIVVAWELCWYRYEVDLTEEPLQASLLAQGTELTELEREEREVNAAADDAGAIMVLG